MYYKCLYSHCYEAEYLSWCVWWRSVCEGMKDIYICGCVIHTSCVGLEILDVCLACTPGLDNDR